MQEENLKKTQATAEGSKRTFLLMESSAFRSLQRSIDMVALMYLLSNIFVLTSSLPSADVSTVISGFVDEDVILPCFFPANERYPHSTITVFWKFKSENIPVHYVLEGVFQSQIQDERFTERTKLF
ncbi:unnamed protein product, partial [Staurois parvus]